MGRLFLIRHAATGASIEGRFYGSTDLPLSETGVHQARLVAEKLSSENLMAVFSSPLKRALETATTIALAHNIQIDILNGLREVDFGAWEGLSFDEIKARHQEGCEAWLGNPWNFTFPRGESMPEFKERVVRALNSILSFDGNLAVVSHGGPLRVILSHLGSIEESESFSCKHDHAGVTIIETEGSNFRTNAINDTTHLF